MNFKSISPAWVPKRNYLYSRYCESHFCKKGFYSENTCSQTLPSIWSLTAQKGWGFGTSAPSPCVPAHPCTCLNDSHLRRGSTTEEIALTKRRQTTHARPSLPTTQMLSLFNLLVVALAALKSIQNQRQCLIPSISHPHRFACREPTTN